MFNLVFLALSFLAAPTDVDPAKAAYEAERFGRLFAYAGQTLELFADPSGPRPDAAGEKLWRLHWVQASAKDGFQVVLSEAFRAKKAAAGGTLAAPLTFRLAVEYDGCGSAHFKGTATEQPEASIEIVSHKTRMCEDLPANDLYATLRKGGVETKMFLPPDMY